jgi:hypothetical protein
MRTGFDVRRCSKPAVFLELVDTRWDEYSRIAEINAFSCPVDSRAVYSPGMPTGSVDGTAMPATADPMRSSPGSGNGLPPDSDTYRSPNGAEPSSLPGIKDEDSAPAGARIPPTARKPLLGGPRMASRIDDTPTAESAEGAVQTSGVKPARRPIASRLFSRPQ